MLIQEQSIRSLDLSDLDLDGEKGEKEANEREREESMSTDIKKESHVEDIEEKKQDVEKKPKVTIVNENTFDKLVDVIELRFCVSF